MIEDMSESQRSFSREHYALLTEIIDRLAWSQNTTDLFTELADPLLTVTRNDLLSLSIYNSDRKSMNTRYWKRNQESGEFVPVSIEEDPNGWVWKCQERVTIPDTRHDQRFSNWLPALREHGIGCYTALPMSTPSEHFGALGFGNNTPQVHTEEDIQFLSRIARLASWAQEKEMARRYQEHQQSLLTISRDVSCILDLDELLRKIISRLRSIPRYASAGIAVFDNECKNLLPYGEAALTTFFLAGPIPVEQAVSARAVQTKSAAILDGDDLGKMATPWARAMYEGGVRSICCLPLVVSNRIWGTLDLPSTVENAFSSKDAEYLRQIAYQIGVALQTAHGNREIAQLQEALRQQKENSQNRVPAEARYDNIIGNSVALTKVMDDASIVAETESTVLITGETGTGKEVVARAIHGMSGRKNRAFIKVNCAAIPSGLLESELFGHEKGAFTGAVNQKIGRLEAADKGTLFLDEIGEIPLDLQPKLLRVLQDCEFERLGSTRTIRVDVRLIAATNVNLFQAVQEKRFRSDLFYRLHVFPLRMPALRDRREDIPQLVHHFVEKFAAGMQKDIDVIPDEAMESFLSWDWPGNIRELENFIERSVILSPAKVLNAPLAELRKQKARSDASSDSSSLGFSRD